MEGNAISVKIGAETDGIEQGLKSIQQSLGRLENSSKQSGDMFDASFGKIAGATAVGQLAVKAFTGVVDAAFSAARNTIQGFTDALDLGGKLSDLSASTGESAGNLLLLQRAFDNTGVGAEAVGSTLAKLQNKIFEASEGGKEATAAFGRMGLSMEDLAGKTPTQQLALVASGINSIEDPARRAATAIDIFGKSGAQILPLLTNFSGEIDEARATVGTLADIMDRRANVFDAVGDRFLIISQKVRDFSAGILDRALPAIDAITSALSRIDAAAIGQRLANAFIGGQQAMAGFQAAVDAISIGQISQAFSIFWDSLKLQSQQTANEIYKNLVAGFKTAGDFVADIFDPNGFVVLYILKSFEFLGAKITEALGGAMLRFVDNLPGWFRAVNPILSGLETAIRSTVNQATEDARDIWGLMASDIGFVNAQITGAAKRIDENFNSNLATSSELFTGLDQQAQALNQRIQEQAAATAATTAEREKQAAQLDVELAARQALKDQAEATAAAEKAAKLELVTLETQLNEAKAAGNTELVASLAKDLEALKAKQEIATLTEQYTKDLKITRDEAGVLATNFVIAKNAAADIAVDPSSIRNAANAAGDAAKNAASFASWADYIAGTHPEKPMKSARDKAIEARQEVEAFGRYIGEDLSQMPFPDVAKKLGIDAIGPTGTFQIDEVLKHLEKKRQDLEGIVPVDDAGSKTKIDELGTYLGETLKKSVDLAVSTGEGSKILGDISGFVETIKGFVETIKDRLPQQALA